MDSSPVSRLPAEVLCLVFLMCALQVRPSLLIHRPAQGLVLRKLGSGWLDLTQVCSAWRTAALEYSTLWACGKIPFDMGRTWAQKFLARSGEMPVEVSLNSADFEPRRIPNWVGGILRDHIHRVENLDVSRGEETSLRVIESLGAEAPRLKSLSLVFSENEAFGPSSSVHGLLSAPMLHLIVLNKVECDLSRLSWHNLRTLYLHQGYFHPKQILQALSTAPRLEKLLLSDIDFPSPPFHDTKQVNLPQLGQMDLHGEGQEILELWKNIAVPSTSRLTIAMNGSFGTEFTVEDVTSMLQLVRTHLSSIAPSGRVPVKYHLDISSFVSIRAISAIQHDDLFTFNDKHTVFALHTPQYLLEEIDFQPAQLIASIPMHNCEVLDLFSGSHIIPGWYPWSPETWSAVAPQTARVESLRISESNAIAFLSAAIASLTEPTTLFPSLRHLHLDRVTFGLGDIRPNLTSTDVPQFCKNLVSWLKLRKSRAVTPIRELVIRECDLYAEWLTTFDEIDDLHCDWDGYTGSCHET